MSVIHKAKKALRSLLSGDRRWWRALRYGVAPSLENLPVLGLIRPEVVVDIGANRGQFALVARHCYPVALIRSFEPLPGPAKVFRSVFAGDGRVQLHESAIGMQTGSTEIHVSACDDSSSLLPIGAEQNRLFPGTAETGTQSIRVGRLTEFITANEISSPALLKLDVQGFEIAALQGCEGLLDRFAWVYCECSFVEYGLSSALRATTS
jgi:FkbM family methyltransferase